MLNRLLENSFDEVQSEAKRIYVFPAVLFRKLFERLHLKASMQPLSSVKNINDPLFE